RICGGRSVRIRRGPGHIEDKQVELECILSCRSDCAHSCSSVLTYNSFSMGAIAAGRRGKQWQSENTSATVAGGHPHGAAGGLQGPPHRRGGPVSGFVADDGLVVRARQPLGREEERLPAGGPGGAGGPCQAAFQRGGPPNRALEDAHRPVQADGGVAGDAAAGRRPRSAATCVDGRRGLGARARCRAGDPARSVRARRPRPRAPVLVRTWRSGAPTKIGAAGSRPFSAPGGPRRASGSSRDDAGRKTCPGEAIQTSGVHASK
ncbi:unnamed protein product, partial [Prorocentrum cordatum]